MARVEERHLMETLRKRAAVMECFYSPLICLLPHTCAHRSGCFDVLDMEPHSGGPETSTARAMDSGWGGQQVALHNGSSPSAAAAAYSSAASAAAAAAADSLSQPFQKPMSEIDLDTLRRRFETLLPSSEE